MKEQQEKAEKGGVEREGYETDKIFLQDCFFLI